MEKDVRGVTKDFCHVGKDVFLLDKGFFHVKKLPWKAISGAFLGPWKNLKSSAGAGFEGFWGASSRGGERFQPGAARWLPGVGLSYHTYDALPCRLSCQGADDDGRRFWRKQGLGIGGRAAEAACGGGVKGW